MKEEEVEAACFLFRKSEKHQSKTEWRYLQIHFLWRPLRSEKLLWAVDDRVKSLQLIFYWRTL